MAKDQIIGMNVNVKFIKDVIDEGLPYAFIYVQDDVAGVCSNMDRPTSERLIKKMADAIDRADPNTIQLDANTPS